MLCAWPLAAGIVAVFRAYGIDVYSCSTGFWKRLDAQDMAFFNFLVAGIVLLGIEGCDSGNVQMPRNQHTQQPHD